MKTKFGLLMILLWSSLAPAQTPSLEATTEDTLQILSWNIYMLPRFARITGKRQRAHSIAEQLQDSPYDILVFQEAFLGDARRILRKKLKSQFPYEYGPANRKFSIRTNSGIWVLSRLPLQPLGEIAYSECDGFDDCMARKGALLLQGEWKGQTFQVLGTHLQAGGPDTVRHIQTREMEELLAQHRQSGIPQIICGDMNTRREDGSNYARLLGTLGCEDGEFCGPQLFTSDGQENDMKKTTESRKVIDFIFYRGNGIEPASILREVPLIRQRWSRQHQDLSDHFPVAVRILWK